MRRAISVVAGAAMLVLGVVAGSASAGAPSGAAGPLGAHDAMVQYVQTHGYIPIGGPAAYARYSAAAAARAAKLHPGRRSPAG